jgi:3-oxoacyl-[acyl-carrier protein] reductase
MQGLEGKVALVAAASSGIGRGIAEVLSGRGCRVTIFSRDIAKLRQAARDIEESTGRKVSYYAADMREKSSLKGLVEFVHADSGKIDFLVMNYGDPRLAPFAELSDSDWDENIEMFLKSTIFLTRTSLRDMEGGGRIIYVTSMTTKMGIENFAISGSLRSAVVNLAKVLSLEYGSKGITVNSISQGYVLTDRVRSIANAQSQKKGITFEDALNAIRETIPMKRFGTPKEVGELVAFLCSDEAAYITGVNLQIDGGYVRFPF